MAEGPFSPWRPLKPGERAPELSTEISPILAACGALYRELIKAGIAPPTADQMELWQIAELMKEIVDPNEPPKSEDLIRMRMEAAERGEEPPEAAPVSDAAAMAMQQAFMVPMDT